jgi:GNAT superfamily N-acetyltransferase
MTYKLYTLRQRPRLRGQFDRMHALAWPPFLQGDLVNALWPSLYTDFLDYQIGLCDRSGDVVAIGNTIPFPWNGRPSGLPARVSDVIARGIKAAASGRQSDTLAAFAAIVDPARRRKGLSARIVMAMRDLAAARGFKALVVPVRPSHKAQYPLIPMESYLAWKRRMVGPSIRGFGCIGALADVC